MGWGNRREDKMTKPNRWTAEKRYEIVKEALSQKEPIGQTSSRMSCYRVLKHEGLIQPKRLGGDYEKRPSGARCTRTAKNSDLSAEKSCFEFVG